MSAKWAGFNFERLFLKNFSFLFPFLYVVFEVLWQLQMEGAAFAFPLAKTFIFPS